MLDRLYTLSSFIHDHQAGIALLIFAGIFVLFILEKHPPEVTAILGVAVLMLLGILPTKSVLASFSSPAPITIIAMFILSGALIKTGVLNALSLWLECLSRRGKRIAMILLLLFVILLSAFVNNTPLVVVFIPVTVALARSLQIKPSKFLIPLSYAAILGGTCTLIGTSTNILVDGIASDLGQPHFRMFEITPVGAAVALSGSLFILLFGHWLLPTREESNGVTTAAQHTKEEKSLVTSSPSTRFMEAKFRNYETMLVATHPQGERPLEILKRNGGKIAFASLVFFGTLFLSSTNFASIAGVYLVGAVFLLVTKCLSIEEALDAVDGRILVLIFAMLAMGVGLQKSGAIELLEKPFLPFLHTLSPIWVLAGVLFLASLLTEMITNNAVAVLMTPLVINIAQQLHMNPRPLLIAVMIGASASFATPIGYQTNTLIYRIGGYRFVDFVRIGLPVNILVIIVSTFTIPIFWRLT